MRGDKLPLLTCNKVLADLKDFLKIVRFSENLISDSIEFGLLLAFKHLILTMEVSDINNR